MAVVRYSLFHSTMYQHQHAYLQLLHSTAFTNKNKQVLRSADLYIRYYLREIRIIIMYLHIKYIMP